jgi:hypothetical protein
MHCLFAPPVIALKTKGSPCTILTSESFWFAVLAFSTDDGYNVRFLCCNNLECIHLWFSFVQFCIQYSSIGASHRWVLLHERWRFFSAALLRLLPHLPFRSKAYLGKEIHNQHDPIHLLSLCSTRESALLIRNIQCHQQGKFVNYPAACAKAD